MTFYTNTKSKSKWTEFKVSETGQPNNSNTNIPTGLTLSKMAFFIISVVGVFFICHYKWIPISIQKNVPLKGSTCFEVASQIVDLNQFCFILYVLLWTRHICNVMLKNSYQFLWFKNYSIFLDEHFSVLLIIDSSLSNLWTTGLYTRA